MGWNAPRRAVREPAPYARESRSGSPARTAARQVARASPSGSSTCRESRESLQIEARRAATAPIAGCGSAPRSRRPGAARLPLRHRRHRPARGARAARGRADPLRPPHRGARALQRRARALRVGRLARPAPVPDRGLRLPRAARERHGAALPPDAADAARLRPRRRRAHARARRGPARLRARGSLRPRRRARRRGRAGAPDRADRGRPARRSRSASSRSCSRARASSSSCWRT